MLGTKFSWFHISTGGQACSFPFPSSFLISSLRSNEHQSPTAHIILPRLRLLPNLLTQIRIRAYLLDKNPGKLGLLLTSIWPIGNLFQLSHQ